MKNKLKKKIATVFLLMGVVGFSELQATGIPTVDLIVATLNEIGNLEGAQQSAHLATQIQQMKEQYDVIKNQYHDMAKNTQSLDAFLWKNMHYTIKNFNAISNMKQFYTEDAGYLNQFHDVDYYRQNNLDSNRSLENTTLSSQLQKQSHDAVYKALLQQHSALEEDAARLASLQDEAKDAAGRMAAIQYSNQFLSEQNNQLLQMRAMMQVEQNKQVIAAMAGADRSAIEQAAYEVSSKRNGPSALSSHPRMW
jgi:type IV secretion system protein TrbJ